MDFEAGDKIILKGFKTADGSADLTSGVTVGADGSIDLTDYGGGMITIEDYASGDTVTIEYMMS